MTSRAQELLNQSVPLLNQARSLVAKAETRTVPSTEELFTSSHYFGVTTATPLQRAVCRIADGLPLGDLVKDEHVKRALSSWTDPTATFDPTVPIPRPTSMVYLAGTRCGKTRFAVALAVHMALACDLSHLALGEIPRVPIVSLSLDLADVAFSQLSVTCMAQPRLKALLVGEPTAGLVVLKHPSGRHVEIQVTAGKKAGGSLVARWIAGVVFDEAPRMDGSGDAVVNLSDMRTAVETRKLPGAIALELGSPWASFGPVHEAVTQYHGRPSDGVVVIRGKGWWLNPYWWTEARRAEMASSKRAEVRQALRTDGEAEFVDTEESMFSSFAIESSIRSSPATLPRERGQDYSAAMDPATRGNAWTLVVTTRRKSGRIAIAYAKQWLPEKGKPLDPDAVLKEIATIIGTYGLDHVETDQWATDFAQVIAQRHGLSLVERAWNAQNKWDAFKSFGERLANNEIELLPEPALLEDLKRVKRRVTQAGVQVHLPKTADGRHCDYAPAVVLSASRYLAEPIPDAPEPGTKEAYEAEEQRLFDEHMAKLQENRDRDWWDV